MTKQRSGNENNTRAPAPVETHPVSPICPSPERDSFSVLVADDNKFYLNILAETIRENISPDRLFTAQNGSQALEIYRQESPDIILLDWEMPGLTGLDVTREIREMHHTPECSEMSAGQYPYIIIVTGRDSPDSLAQAFRNGADDFLRKPADKTELVSRILVGKRVSDFSKALARQSTEMVRLARIDALTGLHNRKHGEERLAEVLNACARKNEPVAVCFCDLDRFKAINDTYGHAAGDDVLRAVGDFLKNGIRISDAAVRWGGDEFVLIFGGAGGAEVLIILNRIREAMKDFSVEVVDDKGKRARINVAISVGCSWGYPGVDSKWEDTIVCADKLLYEAKKERGMQGRVQDSLSFVAGQIPGWEKQEPEKAYGLGLEL